MKYQHDRTEPIPLHVYNRSGMVIFEKELSSHFNQAVWVTVKTLTKTLNIYLIYRSPNSAAENNEHLNALVKQTPSASVTFGDMNYSGIDWENGCSDGAGRNFFEATQDAFPDKRR